MACEFGKKRYKIYIFQPVNKELAVDQIIVMSSIQNLYRVLAELAYAIALSDGKLQESERRTFYNIIEEDLGDYFLIAKDRFELLENETTPTIDNAYNHTLFTIKQNRQYFDEEVKQKFIRVIKDVANAYAGTVDAEEFIINRFQRDIREEGL